MRRTLEHRQNNVHTFPVATASTTDAGELAITCVSITQLEAQA